MQSLQFNTLRPLATTPLSRGGPIPGKGTAPVDTFTRFQANKGRRFTQVELAALTSGADLSGVQLPNRDLSKIAFKVGTFLFEANLYCTNLSEAELEGAHLIGAILERADLSKANLSGSNLQKANLECARLKGANLSGAFLMNTNLSKTNLSGANLSNACLIHANLKWAVPDASTIFNNTEISADTPCIKSFYQKLTEDQKNGLRWMNEERKPLSENELNLVKAWLLASP